MSHFRKWFKCNFSSWPDESNLTILAKVVYRWAWNRAIFCSLLGTHHELTILWFRQTHHHDIIIVWFRQTHHHDIIILSHACVFVSPYCNYMLSKRRFWKAEQKMTSGFSFDVSMVRIPNRVLTRLKSASKSGCHLLFRLPKSSFGRVNYFTKEQIIKPAIATHRHVISCRARNPRFCHTLFSPMAESATFLFATMNGIRLDSNQKSNRVGYIVANKKVALSGLGRNGYEKRR